MTSNTPVIVPVKISAYAINKAVHLADDPDSVGATMLLDFTKPAFNYPEKMPFGGAKADVGVRVHWQLPLAHLHGVQESGGVVFPEAPNRWLVTRIIREGNPRPGSGGVTTGTEVKKKYFLIQSDYLDAAGDNFWSSSYGVMNPQTHALTPNATETDQTQAGKVWHLDDWNSATATDRGPTLPSLTAVGPGIASFHAYQPFNTAIFSFIDFVVDESNSDNSTDETAVDRGVVSYEVVGWYSDANKDILNNDRNRGTDLPHLLDELGWKLQNGVGVDVMRRSLYFGTAIGVRWDRDSPSVQSDSHDKRPSSSAEVIIGVGSSTAEAMTALPQSDDGDIISARLFEAFIAGELDQLDADPGGFDETIHASWFSRRDSDYIFEISDKKDADNPHQTSDAELETERQWLAELNRKQRLFDVGVHELQSLRQRLYDIWWLTIPDPKPGLDQPGNHRPPPPGEAEKYLRQLDPNITGTVANQVQRLRDYLYGAQGDAGLHVQLPHGDTAIDLEKSIADCAKSHALVEWRELKRLPRTPFYAPMDPVIVLKGTGTLDSTDVEQPSVKLVCRRTSDLIASYQVNGAPYTEPGGQAVACAEFDPALRDALVAVTLEALLLARAAVDGTALEDNLLHDNFKTASNQTAHPDQFTVRWHQPWRPAFILWELMYYPLPFDKPAECSWVFDAASGRYRLHPPTTGFQSQDHHGITVRGKSELGPLPDALGGGRAQQLIQIHDDAPDEVLEALAQFGVEVGKGFLSQSTEGLTERAMLQRSPGVAMFPDPSQDPHGLIGLIGQPQSSSVPWPSLNDTNSQRVMPFDPFRGGQFVLSRLAIIDSMGRALNVASADDGAINYWHRKALFRAPSVTPDSVAATLPLPQDNIGHDVPQNLIMQLTPRLAQPARLEFDFVDAVHDTIVVDDPPTVITAGRPGPNPVVGWLIGNDAAKTLMVYDPEGTPCVHARLGRGPQGDAAYWQVVPDYPLSLPDLIDEHSAWSQAHPQLQAFLAPWFKADDSVWQLKAFHDLLGTINSYQSSHMANTANVPLKGQIGRPVALLRARLSLGIDGVPFIDPSWGNYITPPALGYLDPQQRDKWRWNLRLGGAQHYSTDGLIGYFTHGLDASQRIDPSLKANYRLLRTAPGIPAGQVYTTPIDAKELALPVNTAPTLDTSGGGQIQAPNAPSAGFVTILADPWRPCRAVSDVLPVTTLRALPDTFMRDLHAAALTIPIGPVITGLRKRTDQPEAGDHTDPGKSVLMPVPSPWTGIWDWLEAVPGGHGEGAWKRYSISSPDVAPHLDVPPPLCARTGYLYLSKPTGGLSHGPRAKTDDSGSSSVSQEESKK